MDSIRRLYRSVAICLFFAVFGLGALLVAPLLLVLGRVERCQPVIRFLWRPLVWFGLVLGIIRLDRGNLPRCRGTIIVANHPSLVDVIFFTVFVPRTLSIAKRAVGRNPFMGVAARSMAIPVGSDLERDIAPYLAKGWNILIFPEGTRSPFTGVEPPADGVPSLHPFRRGAAQLALRTGAPVVCVGVGQSRRILAKRQRIWDQGTRPVRYVFRADAPTVERVGSGETRHAAAVRVTAAFERRVRSLFA